jgi:predicted phosphoribosyltransferase
VHTHYPNRTSAGQVLAGKLLHYAGRPEVIVLALPRGGVPVAVEVARLLRVPLDVFIVRKLGLPGHPELAMGAIASGNIRVINHAVVNTMQITPQVLEEVAEFELAELQRREALYREGRPPLELHGKVVILLDDGLATGSTMRAAIAAVRKLQAARIVVAIPVASADTFAAFSAEVDEIVCPLTPDDFHAVGQWYEDFAQTSDEDVRRLLTERGAP